jgi:glycosyltransferase involved in cell wall biosynthesis
VPFETRPQTAAAYYQAADVYIHAAKVDTFPNTVLEALACGTPVIATEVGGIPEQIRALEGLSCRTPGAPRHGATEATGVLVGRGDAEGMAAGLERLLSDLPLRRRLGQNARRDAEQRFGLARQVDAYLRWYQELLQQPSGVHRIMQSSGGASA